MIDSQNTKANYREIVNTMGKKEFTLLKMQEYGFWPKELPTPYEKQKTETKEQYQARKKLLEDYNKIINDINKLYKEKKDINIKLLELKKQYDDTWDYDKIRADIAKKLMRESIERRKQRKEQKEKEKQIRREAWQNKKAEQIVFIGKGYSGCLQQKDADEEKLLANTLPIIKTDKELADFLCISIKQLRFLVYHRDVVVVDHYNRYAVPKKKGGSRNIAAPKPLMKQAQRRLLDDILDKISLSDCAHGFVPQKSVITSAKEHNKQPQLLINMDLKDFFPTVGFERVMGMFKSLGYSGYIASLLAMICTYCERIPIEVRGVTRYVKISDRILPQGSPASPMITNIICRGLDKRLSGLAKKHGYRYTRYADDMSFSVISNEHVDDKEQNINKFCSLVYKIVSEEGFNINNSKTRYLRPNNRQSVTGIVINNNEIGVPKKWVKKFRAAIYNADKQKKQQGYISAKAKNEISGMAAWLKSVNEERYRKIICNAYEVLK